MPAKGQEDAELAQLMEMIRFEVAKEVGLDGIREGYFGDATNALCGKFGSLVQKRARQLLKNRRVPKNRHTKPRKGV